MVGRCGGRGAAASKSRWITTSPPRHRRARSRSRSSSASPSANIGSRILCTFAGSKLGCGARRVCIRSCRRPTPACQACRRPGVGRTGRHGIARSWASSEPCIPPGAAERDEGLAAPVVPALDRDNMDAQDHIGGGDADYAGGGGRGDVQAERARDRAIECQGSPRRHRARVRRRGTRDQ